MIKDVFYGIKVYSNALSIIKQLKLWKFFLIPTIIGLFLGGSFIVIAYNLSDNIGSYISDFWTFEFGKLVVEKLSSFIGGVAVLLVGLIVYKHLLMALSAPFMTPVSEKVEAFIRNNDEVVSKLSGIEQLTRSLKLNISNLFKEMLITLPLMLLSFIPVIGLLFTALIFYYQSYFAGIGNMDYTIERHLDYKESKQFYKKNKGVAVGNGLVFTLMLFIPFVGILISLPFATVAATIVSLDKLKTIK